MSRLFERPLPIGKTGKYTFTEDAEWLGNLSITSPSVTIPSGGANVDNVTTDGAVIEATLTGVTAGRHLVEFEFETDGAKSGCFEAYLDVVEC